MQHITLAKQALPPFRPRIQHQMQQHLCVYPGLSYLGALWTPVTSIRAKAVR
jgi:hypothetical protein